MTIDTIAAAEAGAPRFALPVAYADPAFRRCLEEAFTTTALGVQFDRLYGSTLFSRTSQIERMVDEATGKQGEDFRAFVEFVHDCIYLRLPDEAIGSFRLAPPPPEVSSIPESEE
jgi:hypothetical protein